MALTPGDIEAKRFHDSWRGYNHEEVDAFLDEVATGFVAAREQVEAAKARVLDLEARIDTLRSGVEDARSTEMLLKRTLIAAQKAADQAMDESRAQAREVIAAAQERATQIESGATRRAWEIVQEAEGHSRELFDQIAWLRNFDQEQRVRLRDFFEGQLRMLASLPAVPQVGYAIEVRDRPAGAGGRGEQPEEDGQPERFDHFEGTEEPAHGDHAELPVADDRAPMQQDRSQPAEAVGGPQDPGAPQHVPASPGNAGDPAAGGLHDPTEHAGEQRETDPRVWWRDTGSPMAGGSAQPPEEETFWAPAPGISPGMLGDGPERPLAAGAGLESPAPADPRSNVTTYGGGPERMLEPVDDEPAPVPSVENREGEDAATQDPAGSDRAPRRRLAGRRRARTASSFRASAGPDREPDAAPPPPVDGPDDAQAQEGEPPGHSEESPSVRDLFWGRS